MPKRDYPEPTSRFEAYLSERLMMDLLREVMQWTVWPQRWYLSHCAKVLLLKVIDKGVGRIVQHAFESGYGKPYTLPGFEFTPWEDIPTGCFFQGSTVKSLKRDGLLYATEIVQSSDPLRFYSSELKPTIIGRLIGQYVRRNGFRRTGCVFAVGIDDVCDDKFMEPLFRKLTRYPKKA